MQNTQRKLPPEQQQSLSAGQASSVLMVPPRTFMFNAQTGKDNEFQHVSSDSESVLRDKAMAEFYAMVDNLRQQEIEVILFDNYHPGEVLPDAVFPNNWLVTNRLGEVLLFPMLTENRKQEVKPEALAHVLTHNGRRVQETCYIGTKQPQRVLEGTGAMVFDHAHNRVFAALSERCEVELLDEFAMHQGIDRVISFSTQGPSGKPIYHTNVMMSIGEEIAIVCLECIQHPGEKALVLEELSKTHKVMEISYQQMTQHFCGNVLQLRNKQGQGVWVMSESAFNGFTPDQKAMLSATGKLLVNAIPTIENVGGGSCRCMLAEIFLPHSP